jgi:hypothetical protein
MKASVRRGFFSGGRGTLLPVGLAFTFETFIIKSSILEPEDLAQT